MKRYNTLNDYLRSKFGTKTGKVSINAGLSCPNRDNGGKGCLFCTDSGGSEFSGDCHKSITQQTEEGKTVNERKWSASRHIAYFQNFSNTYANPSVLSDLYEEALAVPGIAGIAIATRPDCLGDDVMGLLEGLNKRTFLWLELGLQTSSEDTAKLINRGYENSVFEEAMSGLEKAGIKTVVHLIAGLPGENKGDFIRSVKYINGFNPWGVKLHNIYIQRNSPLYEYSILNKFTPLEMDEYIDWVTDAIMHLGKDIIIHRLTGDPDKSMLIAPAWIKHKLRVISEIDRVLGIKGGSQGCLA